jgi:hypothetical protein
MVTKEVIWKNIEPYFKAVSSYSLEGVEENSEWDKISSKRA